MYFISRLLQPVFSLLRTLSSPLRSLMFNIRVFMVNNPLSWGMRALRGLRYRASYFWNMPKFWLRQMRLPAGIRKWIPGLPKGGKTDAREQGAVEYRPDREWIDPAQRGRILPKVAQFSQIHLVNQQTGKRHVLHIGTTIGRSTAEITLEEPGIQPVQIRFAQVDPEQYKAPMLLTHLSGEALVEVDHNVATQPVPIQNESVLTIHDQSYLCEMYAWDRLTIQTRVNASWATSVGPVREVNEDAIGVFQRKGAYLFAIADGVGGGYAGEEVSEFAIKYLLTVFARNIRYDLPWNEIYAKAYEHINREVRNFVYRAPTPAGTTLTSVVIKDWNAHVAHVGDSRLYHQRGMLFEQLTTDHSKKVVIEQNTRHLTEAKEPLPTREVLVKAIGRNDEIEPDIFTFRLQPGDKLLLCTDGVTNQVSHDEIAQLMASERAVRVADRLVALANERDNTDNASAIGIEILEEAYERDAWRARPGERVFVGSYGVGSLRLQKPREMKTIYIRATQTGCLLLLVLLVIGGAIWGIRQLDDRNGEPNIGAVNVPTITMTVDHSPTQPAVDATFTPTQESGTPTRTPPQSLTPLPAQTQTPIPTPLPPTSTIRPSNR